MIRSLFWLTALTLAALVIQACHQAAGPPGKPVVPPGPSLTETDASATAETPREVKIDLDRSLPVALPRLEADLQPASFTTTDGREGWAVRLPGGLPIATPAYEGGLLFVGGGYGSHEFYALDARTGEVVWQIRCADDGPTAAVVEDGLVAFNTESCTVIVAEARSGRIVWQEWLGDPLMSQPTIYQGRLYMAYPGGAPRGVQRNANAKPGGPTLEPAPPGRGVGPATGRGHRLLCADLRSGAHLWEQDITADVISAPIIEGGQVVFTCMDGTSFALEAETGRILWKKQTGATSAPALVNGQVVHTAKLHEEEEVLEVFTRLDAAKGEARGEGKIAAAPAPYLAPGRGGSVGLSPETAEELDATVGFGGGGPVVNSAAALHLNIGGVAAGWAYQGSKIAYARGSFFNAQGRYFNGVRAADGSVLWRGCAVGEKVDASVQTFAPPALGERNLYVCSTQGHLLSLRQRDGSVEMAYAFGQPMVFQPCLAEGNVYLGTANGLVICLRTGKFDAQGWHAWGGNAQHNKTR